MRLTWHVRNVFVECLPSVYTRSFKVDGLIRTTFVSVQIHKTLLDLIVFVGRFGIQLIDLRPTIRAVKHTYSILRIVPYSLQFEKLLTVTVKTVSNLVRNCMSNFAVWFHHFVGTKILLLQLLIQNKNVFCWLNLNQLEICRDPGIRYAECISSAHIQCIHYGRVDPLLRVQFLVD